ncbi:tetratricopeptide repeat protein [Pseudoroseicyclus aestuarii]|uniref:Tetratricopeptide repeat protein n=1 Tax=Pseudoroseicyclus aestuarii TaxID=1795041 RepID=A0A318T9I9_9RHOB|nr:tetratricopeptide repeat protein [Pseudoroseicyclus aestuarii]PYE84978.1 tetratricopeptide repeat protein [Pseudoroseicyclus aestuarii]
MRIALSLALCLLFLVGCGQREEGLGRAAGGIYAPGYAPRGARGAAPADDLTVGHRLMAAGEYELALRAYGRAGAQQGMSAEIEAALGSANLRLGRLGQAESHLRRAVEADPAYDEAWNNLGVLLMERGAVPEAYEVFRRAFAAADGGSETIRDNLRLALAKLDDPGYADTNGAEEFRLVRRGAEDVPEPL